ncbi:MAG TPA: histidine kinase [Pyrinomonadaceae bacterium]|nr:histidine kinase [Pyrinomonadaceae bacterium]
MQRKRALNSTLSKWVLIGFGWAAFALFFASELVVRRAYAGAPPNIQRAVVIWSICAGLWFAATPLMLWLARRFPIDRQRWLVSSFVHLAASALISIFLLGLFVLITSSLGLGDSRLSLWRAFRAQVAGSFHAEVLTYWMMIGLTHGIDYYRKYRERELRASQLEATLTQARLDALRMQLHPHFLFNTLNSISVLMSEDVTAARRMLTRLSDLLRASLDNAATHEVSLKEELEFLNNYLQIEQTRFHDRLTVRMNIDPAVLTATVPNLILQPLVENAIRHGIAPRAQPGVIDISAERENGMVRLKVCDNGAGLGSAGAAGLTKGIGLANTQARLDQLYGANHSFEMHSPDSGGLEVTILIPFRNGSSAADKT